MNLYAENPSTSIIRSNNKDIDLIIHKIEDLRVNTTSFTDNLTIQEKQALKELQTNPNIIIKKADKGGATIILDRTYYRDKLVNEGHLNSETYKTVDNNTDEKVFKSMVKLVLKHKHCLTKVEFKFLTEYVWKSSEMYILPKIHKCKELLTNTPDSYYVEMPPPEDLRDDLSSLDQFHLHNT